MEFNKHWKEYANSEYIGAYSFLTEENGTVKATPQTYTIISVTQEDVVGDGGKVASKTVAYLTGTSKKMIVNAGNSKRMINIFGDLCMFPKNWVGKTITVNAVKVLERREWVYRMHITGKVEAKPKAKREELTPTHKRWDEAKKVLANGKTTIASIKKSFDLSKENEALLTAKDQKNG